MARKTLAGVILFLSTILATSLASALSLGELSLDSRLNQPFRATIPIRHAGDLNSAQVNIKLASRSDFEKAGVDYVYFLNNLRFSVELAGDGTGRVIVTTREPIVEPYLDFLVEARWPTGRMLREYVVLLDPPATPSGETASVEAARGGVASQAAQGRPAPRERVVEQQVAEPAPTSGPRPRTGAQRTELPPATEPGTYRVQHNDTLWEVAAGARPSDSVSVQQTMLALLRNNPEAFIDNNVNRLKSGYVLRLPTEEEASRLSRDQAVAEVSRQNAIWRGETPAAAEPTGPQLKAGEATEEAAPVDAGEPARLSIATPGDSDAGEGVGGESAAALRDQLAATEENLDKAQRENEEMQSRIRDLEEQMATLQRLLEVRDEQLSALQDAAQTGEAAPTPAQPAPPADEGADELLGGDNRLLINIGLGLAILLLLGALMLYQRRRRQQAERPAPLDRTRTVSGYREEEEAPAVAAATAASAYAASRPEAEAAEEEPEEADAEARERFFGEEESDEYSTDDLLGEEAPERETQRAEPVEAETGDAIAEAEIYVAYGRYDQAAEMLKNAISREPERSDLRVKLLEIYLDTHDRENFLREFEALEALGDDDAVSRVKESMSAIEGVSDWLRPDEAEPAGTAAEAGPRGAPDAEPDESAIADKEENEEESFEFDLDLSDESDLGEFDFDFEVDEASGTEPEPRTPGAPETKDKESLDFELDIDLDKEEEDKPRTQALDEQPAPESYSLDESLDDELRATDLEDLDFDLDELEDESELAGGDELEAERRQAPEAEPEPKAGEESTPESESDEGVAFEMPGEEAAEPEGESTFAGFDEQLEGAGAEEDMDDLGLLGDSDEVSTKLDLARAYIDMGDADGAREMLQEVVQEGDDSQKQEANALLERL